MNRDLAKSVAKTDERFVRSERGRSALGYSHTAEFGAAVNDGIADPLVGFIRDRLKQRDEYGLRELDPFDIAYMGFAVLIDSIVLVREQGDKRRRQVEPGRSIEIGLIIQNLKYEAMRDDP